jgi:hypothetical protein
MSRLKFVLLSLISALLITALAAASASAAAPEFRGPAFPLPITVSGGQTVIQTVSLDSGSCSVVSGAGALTGPKRGTVTLHLSNCGVLPYLCHAEGNASKLDTVELELVPVFINKEEHQVGILLRPATGTTFAHLGCTPNQKAELKGSLVSRLIGTSLSTTHTLELRQTRGIQVISQYFGESGETINSWLEFGQLFKGAGFQREGWETNLTLTATKEFEISRF